MSISPKPSASSENETISHPVLKDHLFPLNSIGPENQDLTFWKCNQRNTYYDYITDSDGSSYVLIRAEADVWQDVALPVAANPLSEGRPEYMLGCQYNNEWLKGCRLKVFLIEGGGGDGEQIFDEPLGPPSEKDVTWISLTPKRINVPEHIEKLRVKFETPRDVTGHVYLKEAVMTLLLPAFDN